MSAEWNSVAEKVPGKEAKTCPKCGYSVLVNRGCLNPRCDEHFQPGPQPVAATVGEILGEQLFDGRRWGCWEFRAKDYQLVFAGRKDLPENGYHCEVDIGLALRDVDGFLLCLDIVQQKRWVRAEDLGNLYFALQNCWFAELGRLAGR